MIDTRGEISAAEFGERRERATVATRAAGLDALIVCGRGGGTLDRYGDVLYLTNFYSSFPYIPDHGAHWSGRAHAFVVIRADSRVCLIADVPSLQHVALEREAIVLTDRVLESLVEVLRTLGLDTSRLGIAGMDTLPTSVYRRLIDEFPGASFEPADGIMTTLRAVKSIGEIARLRYSAEVGSRTIEAMLDAARPGATHGDVVAAGMQILIPRGGILYNSFMASGTGGDSPTLYRSTFPTWGNPTPLADGQWLRLGISGVIDGYYFDVSRSKAIGRASNRQIDAFEAAIAVVESGIDAAVNGATAGQVAQSGIDQQQRLGYPLEGLFSGLGHGIGLGWDAPWLVPDDDTLLIPNMVINVEKTLSIDGYLGDFEETLLVTDSGPEVLTNARKRAWA